MVRGGAALSYLQRLRNSWCVTISINSFRRTYRCFLSIKTLFPCQTASSLLINMFWRAKCCKPRSRVVRRRILWSRPPPVCPVAGSRGRVPRCPPLVAVASCRPGHGPGAISENAWGTVETAASLTQLVRPIEATRLLNRREVSGGHHDA